MNTVENLPVLSVVYVACLLVGAAAPVVSLGWWAFGARMAQSIVHISARTPNAVRLRALMQFVQIGCFAWLGIAAIIGALAA